jgi:cytochrome c55X
MHQSPFGLSLSKASCSGRLVGTLLLPMLAACSTVVAQQPAVDVPAAVSAPSFPPEQIALGRKIYGSYCTRCHGLNMVASSAAYFDLRTFPADARERFDASIRNGLRAMPAWKDALKPEEIDGLWAYVIDNKPK